MDFSSGLRRTIARSVTAALRVKLLASSQTLLQVSLRTTTPEAYQAYLQGNYFSNRATKEDLHKALAYSGQAIKLDPKYAPAWALRSYVLSTLGAAGMMNGAEAFQRSRDDAEQAITLDPNLAGGYLSLAQVQIYHDWQWQRARILAEEGC